jgi:hypothetical protein
MVDWASPADPNPLTSELLPRWTEWPPGGATGPPRDPTKPQTHGIDYDEKETATDRPSEERDQ